METDYISNFMIGQVLPRTSANVNSTISNPNWGYSHSDNSTGSKD